MGAEDTQGQCDSSARHATADERCRNVGNNCVSHGEPTGGRPRPRLGSPPVGRRHRQAWWPRADRITNELPGLVAALTPLLGDICSVNVNWPALQRPPDFNWHGWEHKRQHVMTFIGGEERVNLLIVPYATYSGLALMVLRRAAGLPVDAKDRDKPAFLTAGSILQAARQQCAADR